MGTRHMLAVQLDGEYKIAQYGQFDGYPSARGCELLALLKTVKRSAFVEKLRASRFATPEEINKICAEAEARGWDAYVKDNPQWTRSTSVAIIDLVTEAPAGIMLDNQLEFARDSLFCEWAYVVDLDKDVLEVYKGFNEKPLPEGERFAFLGPDTDANGKPTGYYPVRLLKTYPLQALPTDDQLVKDCDPDEEDAPVSYPTPDTSDTATIGVQAK